MPLPARLAVVASYRLCITTSGDDLCPYLQSRRVGPRTTPAAMMNDRTRRFGKDPRVSESTVPGAGDCRHTAGVSRTRCAGRPSPGPGEDARVVCASARLRVCMRCTLGSMKAGALSEPNPTPILGRLSESVCEVWYSVGDPAADLVRASRVCGRVTLGASVLAGRESRRA